MDYRDILGKRFGKFVVVKYLGKERYTCKSQSGYNYRYLCQCDCGVTFETLRRNIVTEHKKSCGCERIRAGNRNGTWKGYEEISGQLWTSIKRHARGRALPFEITMEEAWERFISQGKDCALSGLSLEMHHPRYQKKGRQKNTASLDRIDSSRGYTPDNIQWVHKMINQMKRDLSQEDFIMFCRAVATTNAPDLPAEGVNAPPAENRKDSDSDILELFGR